jgi:hypothetical protein
MSDNIDPGYDAYCPVIGNKYHDLAHSCLVASLVLLALTVLALAAIGWIAWP